MSDYIRHWKVGSTAEWRGPFGKLNYSQNKVPSFHEMNFTYNQPENLCTYSNLTA